MLADSGMEIMRDSFQWWEVLNEELLSEAEVIRIALTLTRRTVGWRVGCMLQTETHEQ